MALGLLGLCEGGPRLVFGLLGGVLADRYDRLRLLTVIQFFSSLPIFVFAFLYFAGVLEFWHILVLEVIWGIIRSINPSASQSLLHELVPSEELMDAVALSTIGFNFSRIVGPSIGGILLLWIGAGGSFLLCGISLVLSGLEMLFIHLPKRETVKGERNVLREIQEGLRYIRQAPVILSSIGAAYVISIFASTYVLFLPVFAKEVLNVGPEGLGILMAAPGLGAITSLLFLATADEHWKKETLLCVTATVTPLFLILFCLSRNFLLSVGLLALVGAVQIAFRTISRVIIQIETPRDLLGRVISVFVMDQGMRSVGSLVIGIFASIFGAALGLALTSVGSLTLTSMLFFHFLGARRKNSIGF